MLKIKTPEYPNIKIASKRLLILSLLLFVLLLAGCTNNGKVELDLSYQVKPQVSYS